MSDNQKIIALIDGSIYSASVCEYASWIAKRSDAPIELVHILARKADVESADHSGAIALGARTALLAELAELDEQRAKLINQQGRAILEDARKMIEASGIQNVSTRLLHGDLLEVLPELEQNARVIVMGKRGEAADFAKGHLGSNLERVARASQAPVFVSNRAFKDVQKVLLAFDGGGSAIKAVQHVANSKLFSGLEIEVVHVGNDEAESHRKLAEAGAILTQGKVAHKLQHLSGNPEVALAKYAEEEGFGLLIMGAYGHSRIRNLLIGSITTEMVRSCKIPVVLIR